MSKKRFLFWLITFFFVLAGSGTTTSAQEYLSLSSEIDFNISPEFPSSGEEVTFELTSFTIDLQSYSIIWKLNGEQVASGIGKTEYSLIAGSENTSLLIEATILLPTETVIKRRSLTPGGVDILWEAPDSYIPPFYKGKALPGREARIRVSAIPRISSFKNSASLQEYIYDWSRGYDIDGDSSGYGKTSFTYNNKALETQDIITAQVSNLTRTFTTADTVRIPTFDQEIELYPVTELGKSARALENTYTTSESTLSLIAEPFYFSDPDPLQRNLTYVWRVNDNIIGNNTSNPFRKTANIRAQSQGQGNISVSIDNPSTLFQTASTNASLLFR